MQLMQGVIWYIFCVFAHLSEMAFGLRASVNINLYVFPNIGLDLGLVFALYIPVCFASFIF